MDELVYNMLVEMRDLLTLLAEPQIAVRDAKQRESLRKLVGKSEKAKRAVVLMDGTRKQKDISDQVPIAKGQLSELVKALLEAKLCAETATGPKLVITIGPNFLEDGEEVK